MIFDADTWLVPDIISLYLSTLFSSVDVREGQLFDYEFGETIKGLMGPKIGFGGVACGWIEKFSKVFRLLLIEKCSRDTRAVLFKRTPAPFVFAFTCLAPPNKRNVYNVMSNS